MKTNLEIHIPKYHSHQKENGTHGKNIARYYSPKTKRHTRETKLYETQARCKHLITKKKNGKLKIVRKQAIKINNYHKMKSSIIFNIRDGKNTSQKICENTKIFISN